MSRSDLIREVAQHLEPWAWETKSFNATMARDDAMFKAEQIVDLFSTTPATLDNTAVEGARVAAFHAIYGKQADPFTRPEAYEYASEVADAVLATLTAKTEKAE